MKRLIKILFILVTCSSFAQNNWEPINLPDSVYPTTINAENENALFISSLGINGDINILRSYDNGVTWETLGLTSPYYIPVFTIGYHSDGALFVGTRNSIFRSFDNGNNFEEVYSNYDFGAAVTKIRFSPTNEIYALGRALILRSIDIGSTWDTLYSDNVNQYFVDIGFGLTDEIYTVSESYDSVGSGFFRSIDHGETWENIGITDKHLQSICVNKYGTILVSGSGTGGVYSSSDLGSSWTQNSEIQADIIESFGNNNLIAGRYIDYSSGCWLSQDHGDTWVSYVDSVLNPHVHQISISPSGHAFIQSNYNANYSHQIFKSITPLFQTEVTTSSPEIEIYPNPSKGSISILLNPAVKTNQFMIYNQTGQKVLSGKVVDNMINISELHTGLYIIEFDTDHGNIRKKMIIE